MYQYVPNMDTKVSQIWITSRSPWNTEDVSCQAYFLILEVIILTNMDQYIPKHSPENIFLGWLLGSHCFFQCKYSYGRNKKIPLFQWTTIFVHIYVPIWYATNSISRIGSKICVNIDKYRPALCFFISTSIFINLLKIGLTPPNVCASGLCLHALACMCPYLLMHEYALSQDELPLIYISQNLNLKCHCKVSWPLALASLWHSVGSLPDWPCSDSKSVGSSPGPCSPWLGLADSDGTAGRQTWMLQVCSGLNWLSSNRPLAWLSWHFAMQPASDNLKCVTAWVSVLSWWPVTQWHLAKP